jgi:hypothetical protein
MALIFVVTLIPKPNYGEASSPNYMIGVGSHDITGPAADVNMMGYANPAQNAAGIHMRLRARAFIVAESSSSNGGQQERVVFVNTDACMASTAVTLRVLARLKDRYGDLYTEKNVAISGTHTHSGPGGYLQRLTIHSARPNAVAYLLAIPPVIGVNPLQTTLFKLGSKAEQRIQLAVRCVGWHVRLQNSGWLSVAAADALSLLVRPRR